MTPLQQPTKFTLDDPAPPLRWLESDPPSVDLGSFNPVEMWGLVALAALARLEGQTPLRVKESHSSSFSFARAVGFLDVIEGKPSEIAGEAGRTVKLTRVERLAPTEPPSHQIAELLVSDPRLEDTRKTLYYVLNELLRNVVQHSHDALGGVVGAQLNDRGRTSTTPMVQVAVADAGIGIPKSLQPRHPRLGTAQEALDKSLWPHISSTFDEGETGSAQNAGMGLFFISEMTKLVGGRLVIATRGATLVLEGDQRFENPHGTMHFVEGGVGFPGTVVAFEMPAGQEQDYDAMVETIRERARERTPRRAVHQWLSFDTPPANAQRFVVKQSRAEDTGEARRFAEQVLTPRLVQKQPIALDFSGISVCTQSYVHALLFEPLRIAWATKTPIFVVHARPAVRSTLELLENYALGG